MFNQHYLNGLSLSRTQMVILIKM